VEKRGARLVELEVRDVVPLGTGQNHAVVLTSEDGTVLPLFVTEEAAIAIAFRLAHRQTPHPLAADLADRIVSRLGGEVLEVRIEDIQDHIFYGRVFLRQGSRRVAIDARPSDAIALALSGGARIFATQRVMAQGGVTREQIAQRPSGSTLPTLDGGISL
jgi:hypothetical protein